MAKDIKGLNGWFLGVLLLFFLALGGVVGYGVGNTNYSVQLQKPEPFTINGYTSESDFDAVLAQTTCDRLDADRNYLEDYRRYSNNRMNELQDQNKQINYQIDRLNSENEKMASNIAYLKYVLEQNNIRIDKRYFR